MTTVEWHKYPDETPEWDSFLEHFFVTVRYRNSEGKIVTRTELANYNPTAKEGTSLRFYKPSTYQVLAWTKIVFPEPYKEPEPLDMHPDAIAARRYMENHHA